MRLKAPKALSFNILFFTWGIPVLHVQWTGNTVVSSLQLLQMFITVKLGLSYSVVTVMWGFSAYGKKNLEKILKDKQQKLKEPSAFMQWLE